MTVTRNIAGLLSPADLGVYTALTWLCTVGSVPHSSVRSWSGTERQLAEDLAPFFTTSRSSIRRSLLVLEGVGIIKREPSDVGTTLTVFPTLAVDVAEDPPRELIRFSGEPGPPAIRVPRVAVDSPAAIAVTRRLFKDGSPRMFYGGSARGFTQLSLPVRSSGDVNEALRPDGRRRRAHG